MATERDQVQHSSAIRQRAVNYFPKDVTQAANQTHVSSKFHTSLAIHRVLK